MDKSTHKLAPDAVVTVGDLITELCRWPDHAAISFKCPGSPEELCFARIEGSSRGFIEIELHPVAETAPIVPA